MSRSIMSGGVLLTILLQQLLHVTPIVPVPVLSYGQTVEHKVVSVPTRTPRIPPATFTRQNAQQVDTVLFVGDVLLGRNVEYLMEKHGQQYPFAGVSFTELGNDPAVVANFEAAVPKVHTPTEPMSLTFSVREDYLESLYQAGFTHLSLANNHSTDFGVAGLLHTTEALKSHALTPIGHGAAPNQTSISYIDTSHKRVAILALYALEELPDEQELADLFTAASARSELQVVFVHWGIEYDKVSSPEQQDFAAQLVAAGADVVIGHHPHVVQEVGLIDGVPVFYSLGNYIFDQYFSGAVQEGLLLALATGPRASVSILPVSSEDTLSQPTFLRAKEHAKFLQDLAARSDPGLAEQIQAGMVYLNMPVATSSKIAMINQ